MIVTKVSGGLGNQLFQYAMARRLAINHNTEVLLDLSDYHSPRAHRKFLLSNFQIKAREASKEEIDSLHDLYRTKSVRDRAVRLVRRIWPSFLRRATHIVERQYRFQPEALKFPDNVYLQGFWQSEKYFTEIVPLIRQELQLRDETIANSARSAVQQLRERYGTVVSLHVRRGDLAYAHETLGQGHRVHGAPVTLEYIQQAIATLDPDSCFFIFSDTVADIQWCKQNVRAKHLEFSTAESELWDFSAMTECDHHIIANSSFSWWAAWLDTKPDRRVIAPRRWSAPEAKVEMHIDDLIPEDWEII
jgi:Glycosyl transferase family 11